MHQTEETAHTGVVARCLYERIYALRTERDAAASAREWAEITREIEEETARICHRLRERDRPVSARTELDE